MDCCEEHRFLPFTASQARNAFFLAQFSKPRLDELATNILARARQGEFTVDVATNVAGCASHIAIEPDKRSTMFDLLESHAFHYHSRNPATIQICWNFQCKKPTVIDDTLIEGFPRGDEMYTMTIQTLTIRHHYDIKNLLEHVRSASGRATSLVLPDVDPRGILTGPAGTILPGIKAVLCDPTNGFHVHADQRTLCWQWKCMYNLK